MLVDARADNDTRQIDCNRPAAMKIREITTQRAALGPQRASATLLIVTFCRPLVACGWAGLTLLMVGVTAEDEMFTVKVPIEPVAT